MVGSRERVLQAQARSTEAQGVTSGKGSCSNQLGWGWVGVGLGLEAVVWRQKTHLLTIASQSRVRPVETGSEIGEAMNSRLLGSGRAQDAGGEAGSSQSHRVLIANGSRGRIEENSDCFAAVLFDRVLMLHKVLRGEVVRKILGAVAAVWVALVVVDNHVTIGLARM